MNRKHIASVTLLAAVGLALMLSLSSCVSLKLVSQREAGVDATSGATSGEGTDPAPAADAPAANPSN